MRIGLVGYGTMGKLIEGEIKQTTDMKLAGVVALDMLDNLDKIEGKMDVIIDFSHPSSLPNTLEFATLKKIPLVLATTGYTDKDKLMINEASNKIAIVYTANFSLGITVLRKVLSTVSDALKNDFDMEIIEKHHNKKIDAPSGTAKMLLNAIDPLNEFKHVYGRDGLVGKRDKEIGIHAIRGGSIVGEHSVVFAGTDEILEFRHEATSKMIFVKGAIKAARFVIGKKKGLFDMEEVLGLND